MTDKKIETLINLLSEYQNSFTCNGNVNCKNCDTECPFYIDSSYESICAIDRVTEGIKQECKKNG